MDRLTELESARAQTLGMAEPLSQMQLDYTSRPDAWSIGEILDHLVLAEALYRGEMARLIDLARAGRRPYLYRSFDEINVAPLYMPTMLLTLFSAPIAIMSRTMPDSVRRLLTEFPLVPTRNPDVATPRRNRPGAALRAGLRQSLADTRALLAAHGDLDFDRMISEHPLTGPASIPQMLGFLAQHERRHQGQMDRVRRQRNFPPA
jgi:uncharacterized damage-inducible protein DinB